MTLKQYIKRALSLPLHILCLKLFQHFLFRLKAIRLIAVDHIFQTYDTASIPPRLVVLFPSAPKINLETEEVKKIQQLVKHALSHEFNLLGSGWTKVDYLNNYKGILGIKYNQHLSQVPEVGAYRWISSFINYSNRKITKSIWQQVSKKYNPINWHVDFKSGYQWNPRTWWFKVPYGHKPGVDIKVPWELSRFQHLIWMALDYSDKCKIENDSGIKLVDEYQNQILDFIATNPPRFGVNWRCPMDVSIRAANWVVSYSFFKHYGAEFSKEFQQTLSSSLIDHGRFVFNNLEIGSDKFRGNHYLADVCGLAFISASLELNKETEKWLKFSFSALKEEIHYQFFKEGSNFEGSTSYHLLSSEMVLYSILLYDHLPSEKKNLLPLNLFDDDEKTILYNMRIFSEAITRHDDKICQIGDNDSGRFFKLGISLDSKLEENFLCQKSLQDTIQSYFGVKSSGAISADWVYSITKQGTLSNSNIVNKLNHVDNNSIHKLPRDLVKLLENFIETQSIDASTASMFSHRLEKFRIKDFGNIQHHYFHDFGLYIWKSNNFFFSFRCGKVGQRTRGGHDHNDQLSITLNTEDFSLDDPGTGLYTPFPNIRNTYRSISSHFAPQVYNDKGQLIEPGDLGQGLFSLNSGQSGKIIYTSKNILIGLSSKLSTIRIVSKEQNYIVVFDICWNKNWKLIPKDKTKPSFSRGYGLF